MIRGACRISRLHMTRDTNGRLEPAQFYISPYRSTQVNDERVFLDRGYNQPVVTTDSTYDKG